MKSLEMEISHGVESKRIHESIESRLDIIRQNLRNEWESSKADDTDVREHIWKMIKALNELERSYLKDITTGLLAQKQLEEKNGRAEH